MSLEITADHYAKTREGQTRKMLKALAEGRTLYYYTETGDKLEIEAIHFIFLADHCELKELKGRKQNVT